MDIKKDQIDELISEDIEKENPSLGNLLSAEEIKMA